MHGVGIDAVIALEKGHGLSVTNELQTEMIWIDNRCSFNGQVFLLYGILYSVERFFVEALRTDSLMIGSLKQAQVLSASVIVVFSIFYVMLKRRNKKH